MNMPFQQRDIKVPMYILTMVEPNGALLVSEYRTRAEIINIQTQNGFNLEQDDKGDFITQSTLILSNTILILTTIYVQISNQ